MNEKPVGIAIALSAVLTCVGLGMAVYLGFSG
jgi:hypothetical protein